MTKIVELIISEEEKEDQDGVFAISLVEDPAIDEYWIALNKQQKELKFAKVDEDKRLLIAPALIPNRQIFRLADDGSDYYVYFSIDKSVKYGFEHCPVGTWFVTMRVDNDEIWNKVKEGEILGFSIEGFFTDKLQGLSSQSLTENEGKLQMVKDLIVEEESTYLADYPWEQCKADQRKAGYSEEVADKICGAIKNRTIANSVIPKAKAILKGERKKSK